MNSNELMLKQGSFKELVLKLSIPAIVISLVMVIYNVADIFFIGKTNDPNQIAAISLATPVFSLLSGFGTLYGSGGSILISTALGANEKDKVKKISSTSFYLSLLSGFIVTIIIELFTPNILKLLGSDNNTYMFAASYLRIFAIGCGFGIVNTAFGNIIRADGSAVMSMITNLTGTISNIILDAIFILIFGMGVKGAAIATLLANLISFIFIVVYICFKQESLSINLKYFKFNIFKIMSVGFPMACSSLLMSVSDTFSNNIMMTYGSTALSAQSCASKISLLITMSTMGLVLGLQPAISYAFGAKNKERLSYLIKRSIIFSIIIGLTLSAICFVNRERLVSIFINDNEVIELGKLMIIASLIVGPFSGIFYTCTSYLQATANVKYATLVSLLDKFIILLPVLYLSNYLFNMIGVAWSKSITMFISTIIASIITYRCFKKVSF